MSVSLATLNIKMPLIAAHLSAEIMGGDSVTVGSL